MTNEIWPNEPKSAATLSIESLLADHLRPVAAPAALWDRVTNRPARTVVRAKWLIPLTAAAATLLIALVAAAPRINRAEFAAATQAAAEAPAPGHWQTISASAETRAALLQLRTNEPKPGPARSEPKDSKEDASCHLCHV